MFFGKRTRALISKQKRMWRRRRRIANKDSLLLKGKDKKIWYRHCFSMRTYDHDPRSKNEILRLSSHVLLAA